MASYLKPRRGKKQTAINQNMILKKGEIFFEVPNTGVGSGIGKIKMGDGGSTYDQLPYFMEQPEVKEVSEASITFTEAEDAANSTLLNNISSGSKVSIIIGNIKRMLRRFDTSTTELNNKFGGLTFGSQSSGGDTIYGFYVDGEFHPFKHWHISPVNNVPDITLTDDYLSAVSGGCFTQIQYKAHNHVGQIRYGSTDDLVRRLVGPNAIISNTKTGCFQSSVQKITGTWKYAETHDDGRVDLTCDRCGASHDGDPYYQEWIDTQHVCLQYYTLTCGKTAGERYPSEGVEGYVCSCGRQAGRPSFLINS